MPIEIRQAAPVGAVADFIRAGFEVFRGDPAWVPPLDMVFKEKVSPKDPFYAHGEVALFTAWKDGARTNDPIGLMKSVAVRLDDDQVASVAAWLAASAYPKR